MVSKGVITVIDGVVGVVDVGETCREVDASLQGKGGSPTGSCLVTTAYIYSVCYETNNSVHMYYIYCVFLHRKWKSRFLHWS